MEKYNDGNYISILKRATDHSSALHAELSQKQRYPQCFTACDDRPRRLSFRSARNTWNIAVLSTHLQLFLEIVTKNSNSSIFRLRDKITFL